MTAQATVQLPTSAVAGPEIAALAPFYKDWSWSGTIRAGGMGPGSPEMSGKGSAVCDLIQDGLWYSCRFQQDQYLADGSFVLKWQLNWITGWDRMAGEYRACSADNNGPTLAIYRGRLEGDRLAYESLQESLPRIRLTWILSDATHAVWRNEFTVDGLTWNLIEEYEMEAAG